MSNIIMIIMINHQGISSFLGGGGGGGGATISVSNTNESLTGYSGCGIVGGGATSVSITSESDTG